MKQKIICVRCCCCTVKVQLTVFFLIIAFVFIFFVFRGLFSIFSACHHATAKDKAVNKGDSHWAVWAAYIGCIGATTVGGASRRMQQLLLLLAWWPTTEIVRAVWPWRRRRRRRQWRHDPRHCRRHHDARRRHRRRRDSSSLATDCGDSRLARPSSIGHPPPPPPRPRGDGPARRTLDATTRRRAWPRWSRDPGCGWWRNWCCCRCRKRWSWRRLSVLRRSATADSGPALSSQCPSSSVGRRRRADPGEAAAVWRIRVTRRTTTTTTTSTVACRWSVADGAPRPSTSSSLLLDRQPRCSPSLDTARLPAVLDASVRRTPSPTTLSASSSNDQIPTNPPSRSRWGRSPSKSPQFQLGYTRAQTTSRTTRFFRSFIGRG